MSGGELDYVYAHLEPVISRISTYYNNQYCPMHGATPNQKMWDLSRRFLARMVLMQQALHDIEWVMSDDYAHGDEINAMMAVLDEIV